MAEAERQLVIVVEGTAALGPYWSTIVTDYVEKITRSFCASEVPGKSLAGAPPELALIVFHTHGPFNAFCVQRSGWTKDIDAFLSWLSGISFSGRGFSEVPICEGLAEALMILQGSPNTTQNNQNNEAQKHCILVAASNPYPSRTPAYNLPIQCTDQKENIESSKGHPVADAETVAKSFAQCSVSLSVISPKQLPALKAIYNVGKRNPRDADPPVDHAKNPDFLVLLSENFMVARTALSHSLHGNVAPNQTITKFDSAPAVTMPGPTSNANPSGGTTMMGLPKIGETPLQVHVSNTGVDSLGVTNNSAMNMPIEKHPNAQQPPPKYVKIWEGTLSGIRYGHPVFICKLEGYRRGTAAETLAADWPETLEISRIIDREHMNKNYCHRAEFLVFRALNQHGFLGRLKENDLCAVIRLPSQALLLSVSDKVGRLIGWLLPGDMMVWKPPVSDHQPTMQQHQARQQQLQELQHQLQLEQQLVQQLQQELQRQLQQHMHMQPQGLLLQQPQMQHHQQQQMPLQVPSNSSSPSR
ncbi:mediator of RNA polymerase II transcription subunit 25-like isoform X1 [Miscanthus floridulus]|uniref:mediator of RNA polymerase II transcription subunit 25-like isoform X1 n=1 Tax=Miscanthus floridulus TaxID=154761 RepID=UPI00345788E5